MVETLYFCVNFLDVPEVNNLVDCPLTYLLGSLFEALQPQYLRESTCLHLSNAVEDTKQVLAPEELDLCQQPTILLLLRNGLQEGEDVFLLDLVIENRSFKPVEVISARFDQILDQSHHPHFVLEFQGQVLL